MRLSARHLTNLGDFPLSDEYSMLSKIKKLAETAQELAESGREKLDQSLQDGLLAKARDVAKSTASLVQEQTSAAASEVADLTETARQKWDQSRQDGALAMVVDAGSKAKTIASEQASFAADKAAELGNAALDQLNKAIDEVSNGSDEIREAGYELRKIILEIGLIPKAGLTVAKLREVGQDQIAAIIERNKEKKWLGLLLRTLMKTNRVMHKINLRGRKVSSIEIDLSLPPVARLTFQLPKSEASPAETSPPLLA